ncbi:MAG: tyrosine-type recombinase/integrase, partial [Patescibacteria group bacterium]|nr:tyrosine-type recombinase/integrase [Patescibacteria group bacterium]
MALSFNDALVKYNQHLQTAGKANATIVAYTKDVEQLIKYVVEQGRTDVAQVDYEDVKQFKELLKKRRYTNKSISRKINSIKSFFRYLKNQGEAESNPAGEISHPKIEQKPPRYLSKLEYRALRDACRGDARMAAIVELLLQSGMRISELANLKMDDIDLEREVMFIRAQKSREGRKVPVNTAAKEALMDYLKVRPKAKESTVFLTKTCRPFLVRNIRSAINRYFGLAGTKDATVNDLRNTFIVE